jgi:imidazolonepropionase-like amidohydrolase
MLQRLIFVLLAGLSTAISTSTKILANNLFQCDETPLLIENVQLVTRPEESVTLFIDKGRIQDITSTQQEARPNARILDGKGAFVLPGLIDSHTHFDTLAAGKARAQTSDIQTDIFPITMRQTLASGVTTARAHLSGLAEMDLMNNLGNDNCFPSPRISISGPGLAGGLPNLNGRLMRGVASAEDATQKVEELAQLGAKWLALHRIEHFKDQELAAISEAAKIHNVKLMADTDAFVALETAIDLGIASAEYINRSAAAAYPKEILAKIADAPTFHLVAPIGYYRRSHLTGQNDNIALSDNVFSFTPEEITTAMKTQFANEFATDRYVKNIVETYPTFSKKFAAIGDADAVRVVGSDAGSTGHFHHDAIWWELDAWHAFGVHPHDIIKAATQLPAEMLEDKLIGRLSIGSHADILLYSGDIESGEFRRDKVQAVLKGGVIYVAGGDWVGPDTEETVNLIKQKQPKE